MIIARDRTYSKDDSRQRRFLRRASAVEIFYAAEVSVDLAARILSCSNHRVDGCVRRGRKVERARNCGARRPAESLDDNMLSGTGFLKTSTGRNAVPARCTGWPAQFQSNAGSAPCPRSFAISHQAWGVISSLNLSEKLSLEERMSEGVPDEAELALGY
jgi:hypothetical protein